MSVVTPREPASRRRTSRERLATTQQASRVSRWSRLVVASASSPGACHAVNEDSHSDLARPAPVFVVADGVGGGAMAAWASRQVVRRLHAALEREAIDGDALRHALLDVDREVRRGIARRTPRSGAATAAVCVGTGAFLSRWFIGWVGDCRIYRLRGDPGTPPQQLTRDDTYATLGETPPPGGSKDDPARMIGNGAVSDPNVERIELRSGETLVLCSDGVHKYVDAGEMARVLRGPAPLGRRCLQLLELARAAGSPDDATVLVVQREASRRARALRYGCAGALLTLLLSAALFASWPHAQRWWPQFVTSPSPLTVHAEPEPRT
jgi:PPM family protein phosphatase